MRADAAVPVLLAERGRAGELVDGIELQPRARVARLEPPSELELDPARRIEQCLLQRDRDRPDAFDDPSAPQHRAALLLVARSGRQHPSARTQQALAAPPPVADDADERGEDLRHRPVEKRFVVLPLHASFPRRER